MRIFQHPQMKVPSTSVNERLLYIPKITGTFEASDWQARDKKVLTKLLKKHEDPSVGTKSWVTSLFRELYENHTETWNKFHYFGRTRPMLIDSGFRHHYERAMSNSICPVCTSVWLETDFPSCCWVCKQRDPEAAKRLHYETRERLLRERPDYEEWVKAKAKKGMDTFEAKHGKGIRRPLQHPEIKKQIARTTIERYGAIRYNASPEGRKRISRVMSDWCADTAALAWRASRCYNKYKVTIDGVTHTVQGSAERALISLLVAKHGNDRNVVTQFNSKFYPRELAKSVCGYRPDFYVFSKNLFIECKSVWTLMDMKSRDGESVLALNREKAKRADANLVWIVHLRRFRGKDLFLQLPRRWHLWTRSKLANYIADRTEALKRQALL